jgi:hypothetical protein
MLISDVILVDTLEHPRLQLYLHRERSIRVIGLGEDMVATPAAYLMNYPMDHDSIFRGVINLFLRHLLNKD